MQTITITHDLNDVDWTALGQLYLRERGKVRQADLLRQAFQASYLSVVARLDGQVVGAGRVLSDGIFNAMIMDVVVDGAHQGRGIGRAMMEALMADLNVERIDLSAVPGKEGFYEKLGYRPNETAYCLRSTQTPLAEDIPVSLPYPA